MVLACFECLLDDLIVHGLVVWFVKFSGLKLKASRLIGSERDITFILAEVMPLADGPALVLDLVFLDAFPRRLRLKANNNPSICRETVQRRGGISMPSME